MQSQQTIYISLLALILGVFNFFFAIINRRKDLETKERNDFIESENLLDKAFAELYGENSFSSTKNSEKFNEAVSLVKRAKKLTPKYSRAYELEGLCFEMEGKVKKAIESYIAGTKLQPARWQLYNNLGLVNYYKDELKIALGYFEAAVKTEPDNAGLPLFNIGRIYLKKEELETAEKYFLKSLEFMPNSSYTLYELGRIYRLQGNIPEARRRLEKSIAANPKNIDSLVYLGALITETGEWEDGISWITYAHKLNPNDGYPTAMIAALYADKKMYKEALEYYDKTILIDPKYKFQDSSIQELYAKAKEFIQKENDNKPDE
jgi:tetratricopeptide (TPR) repeat protein